MRGPFPFVQHPMLGGPSHSTRVLSAAPSLTSTRPQRAAFCGLRASVAALTTIECCKHAASQEAPRSPRTQHWPSSTVPLAGHSMHALVSNAWQSAAQLSVPNNWSPDVALSHVAPSRSDWSQTSPASTTPLPQSKSADVSHEEPGAARSAATHEVAAVRSACRAAWSPLVGHAVRYLPSIFVQLFDWPSLHLV